MRVEANVSIRRRGETAFGTRVEVKNMNSFRAVERAIAYEIERQAAAFEAGETLTQDTRGWDDTRDATYVMRSKEDSHDYRYFPEPDLPAAAGRPGLAGGHPGTPARAAGRSARTLRVRPSACQPYDARVIVADPAMGAAFEAILAAGRDLPAKEVANLVTGDYARAAKTIELRTADGLVGLASGTELADLSAGGSWPGRSAGRTDARSSTSTSTRAVPSPRSSMPGASGRSRTRRRSNAIVERVIADQSQGGRRLPGGQADDRLPRRPGDEGDRRPGQPGARPGRGAGASRGPADGSGTGELMGAVSAVLILGGAVLVVIGLGRARGPWARYQTLKEQDANVARYEAWRGGIRDDGRTGASVAMEILLRQARLGGARRAPRGRPGRRRLRRPLSHPAIEIGSGATTTAPTRAGPARLLDARLGGRWQARRGDARRRPRAGPRLRRRSCTEFRPGCSPTASTGMPPS